MTVSALLGTRWLFVSVLIVGFLGEALLVSYRDHIAIIQASTSDEVLFLYEAVIGFFDFFRSFDWGVFPEGFPGPYGHPFWFLLVAVRGGSEALGLPTVLVATCFFLTLKYVAAVFWRETLVLRVSPVSANALSIALLASPGLFFYGKIISPEYEVLALVSAAIYLGARGYMADGRPSWSTAFLFFLATYTKVINAPLFAAGWLTAGFAAWRRGGAMHAARILTGMVLVFGGSTWLACFAAGGVLKTLHSILALPVPPAIFAVDHLWRNMTECQPFTWDQVQLLPLTAAFPILFVAVITLVLSRGRHCRSVTPEACFFAWVILLAAAVTLLLMLARSLNYSWYLFVPVTTATIAIFFIVGEAHGRWGAIVAAVTALIFGISQSATNIRLELQKRALLLEGEHRASGLVEVAHRICGPDAFIVLDMLIPVEENTNGRIVALRSAVMTSAASLAIAREQPFIVVSHRQMFTEISAAEMRLINPSAAHFETHTDSSFPGYVFRAGRGCRPVD